MTDILLAMDGDIKVSENGDIFLTDSIRQAVLIRLRWILNEWRLGPEMGFPWFEEVFVKNPNIQKIKGLIRNEVMQVDGVTGCTVTDAVYDRRNRTATFAFTFAVGDQLFNEEVILNG